MSAAMRVLVTGGDGYIGSVMVRLLQAQGYEVKGLDCGYYEGCDWGPAPRPVPTVRKDIRDVTPADLDGFAAVIHLAALSNDPLGEMNPAWTDEINYRAALRLAAAAKQAGVERFLFASSCSMYGSSGGQEALSEEAPLQPLSAYALSKVQAERDIASLADAHFSPVFLRNATAYGFSPRMRFDLVLNNLVGWAFTTGRVRILSDGSPWRPLVHVEDIARAFAAALAAPRECIHNRAFNVGAPGENFQVRDIARIVQETVPGSVVEYAGQSGPDPRDYRVSFERIRRELPGFTPQWTLPRGAQEVYEACRAVGLTLEQFQGRTYHRLQQLKYLLQQRALDDSLRWAER